MTLRFILPAAIAVLASSVLSASAHDFWINHGDYKSPTGVHCCGPEDCFAISASDTRPTAEGWLIKSLGEVVPYSEVLTSEDGKFWRCRRNDGTRRCFFAPRPSS